MLKDFLETFFFVDRFSCSPGWTPYIADDNLELPNHPAGIMMCATMLSLNGIGD